MVDGPSKLYRSSKYRKPFRSKRRLSKNFKRDVKRVMSGSVSGCVDFRHIYNSGERTAGEGVVLAREAAPYLPRALSFPLADTSAGGGIDKLVNSGDYSGFSERRHMRTSDAIKLKKMRIQFTWAQLAAEAATVANGTHQGPNSLRMIVGLIRPQATWDHVGNAGTILLSIPGAYFAPQNTNGEPFNPTTYSTGEDTDAVEGVKYHEKWIIPREDFKNGVLKPLGETISGEGPINPWVTDPADWPKYGSFFRNGENVEIFMDKTFRLPGQNTHERTDGSGNMIVSSEPNVMKIDECVTFNKWMNMEGDVNDSINKNFPLTNIPFIIWIDESNRDMGFRQGTAANKINADLVKPSYWVGTCDEGWRGIVNTPADTDKVYSSISYKCRVWFDNKLI